MPYLLIVQGEGREDQRAMLPMEPTSGSDLATILLESGDGTKAESMRRGRMTPASSASLHRPPARPARTRRDDLTGLDPRRAGRIPCSYWPVPRLAWRCA